ncbi:hypothetical protein DY000_02024946 [Brassica cretica]|uniref:Uncharacterized protein n=1 Tax=Brassica cretica TaxID=69181 RepID=A0ABQ7E4N8_BRACR|nr:hypothetical protein DY000_02024946 [Brassica cretica]
MVHRVIEANDSGYDIEFFSRSVRQTTYLGSRLAVDNLPGSRLVNAENTLEWSDEEVDERVDNLLKLIERGHKFCSSMFKGGATKSDVQRMREDAKARAKENKTSKLPVNTGTVEIDNTASVLFDRIMPELVRIDGNVSSAMTAVKDLERKLGLIQGGTIHWYSLITAMLLMLNHSLGGLEGCRAISSDYVAIEAKVVAVMAYEFHHTLYVVNCDLSYST